MIDAFFFTTWVAQQAWPILEFAGDAMLASAVLFLAAAVYRRKQS